MSFTLRISFSGLCAFVPEKPFSSNEANLGSVKVLLPDLIKPLLLSKTDSQGNPLALDPHYPLLEVNTHQVQAGSRQPDFQSNLPVFEGKGYCLLLEESLTIALGSGPLVPTGVEAPRYDATVGNSLFFVAAMEKISPEDNRIMPALLSQLPKRSADTAPGVIASMTLPQGLLTTAKKTDDIQTINGSNSSFQQQIATRLTLEIPNLEGQILLKTSRPGMNDLILAPDADDPLDDAVEIHLQNREIDSYIGIPLDQPQYTSASAAFDFEGYYKTLVRRLPPAGAVGAPPAFPVPLPQGAAFQPFATVRGGSCPPLTIAPQTPGGQ